MFFPEGDRTAQLLSTAVVFAVGFFMRPLGGWLLGAYADRFGRRRALTLSVTLMRAGSLTIALAPGHDVIGLWAPALLVLARLTQGLSVSEEFGSSASYLSVGGDPTYVWDWYKSNGCLFGSDRGTMMPGWDPTLYVDGPGHHSFVLLDGDIATSPPAGPRFPLMFHAVAKGTPYSWENRHWYTGTFSWWGDITYSRANVPGDPTSTGWSLKFFE